MNRQLKPFARLRISACVAAALCGLTPLAGHATPVGVGIILDVAAATHGGQVNATYASGEGIQPCCHAGLVTIVGGPDAVYSITPGAMPAGLTAADLAVRATAVIDSTLVSTATASASLAFGNVRAYATGVGAGVGFATALMRDEVTWSIANAASAEITVRAHLGGSMTGLSVNGTGQENFALSVGSSSFDYFGGWNGLTPYYDHNGASNQQYPYGWTSYNFTNETPEGFDFIGTMLVQNGHTDVAFAELSLRCATGIVCDYTHTGTFSFDLPSNVTFTSASGVLLSALAPQGPAPIGVPEPATNALLLLGMGLIGACTRRRNAR